MIFDMVMVAFTSRWTAMAIRDGEYCWAVMFGAWVCLYLIWFGADLVRGRVWI